MNFIENVHSLLSNSEYFGKLQVSVKYRYSELPIENAMVTIYRMGNPYVFINQLSTDKTGHTPIIALEAPPLEFSMKPSENLPYTEYAIQIIVPGLRTVEIYGVQIYPYEMAIQPVTMYPADQYDTPEIIMIEPNTLVSYYAPKVYEDWIKYEYESGRPVMIPQYLIIHNGIPAEVFSNNIITKYKEYIKNIISNEIFPTWNLETIKAIILATMSFTLNRIYTNWYPEQGYDFNITSSNAFDNKWVYGRNYYNTISMLVENFSHQYLSIPNIIQPVLTQLCIGDIIACPNMLEKWKAKKLGDQGMQALEILRYFYGIDLYINDTNLFGTINNP